jgi:hypothetical protein
VSNAALAIGSVTQTTGLFLATLPGIAELRKTSEGTQHASEVRTAEAIAAALSLGTGVAMGALGKSSAPVYAALITTATLIAVTEVLLRRKSLPTLRLVGDGETVPLHTEGIPHD